MTRAASRHLRRDGCLKEVNMSSLRARLCSQYFLQRYIPRVANVHDEVHHLIDGDGSILVGISQPKDGGRYTSIAEDLVKGLGADGVILTDEVGYGLE